MTRGGVERVVNVAKRVREECDVLVEASEQLLANVVLRRLFVAGCEGGGGGGGGGVSLLALTVTHSMSNAIKFLLSRPWPSLGVRLSTQVRSLGCKNMCTT